MTSREPVTPSFLDIVLQHLRLFYFFGDMRVEFVIRCFSQGKIRAGQSVQSNLLVGTVALGVAKG